MSDSNITADQINTILFRMATASQQVANALEQESYRLSADVDDATNGQMLTDALRAIRLDLESIGLQINFETVDFTDDLSGIEKFVTVCEYILPNTLYHKLKTEAELRRVIHDIAYGAFGDGSSSVIQVYLSELGGLDGHPALAEELSEFVDTLYPHVGQTGAFTVYLKNLLTLLKTERMLDGLDPERANDYANRTRGIVVHLTDAMKVIPQDLAAAINNKLRFLVADFANSHNQQNYAFILLEDANTIPDGMLEWYHKRWYEYRVSHRWCFDYHRVRDMAGALSADMRAYIACFAYAVSTNVDAYLEMVKPMREYYTDTEIHDPIAALYADRSE